MKHQNMNELGEIAEVVPFRTRMSRAERLERWATLLEHHAGKITALTRIEYLPPAERLQARADSSPRLPEAETPPAAMSDRRRISGVCYRV